MSTITQTPWRILDGNCTSIENARVCLFLTNHKKVGLKELYKQEITRQIHLLSNPILLVEHPDDTKNSPVPAECWENQALLKKIEAQSRKFDFLLKGVEHLLSYDFPLSDKIKAVQHIVNNAKVLDLPVEEISMEQLKEHLKDIDAHQPQLLQAQAKLAEWLKIVHRTYKNQTVKETFSPRQSDLISKISISLPDHSQVFTFCGKSHADPQTSIAPQEAERLVKFVKGLQLPYMIISIES